MRRLLIALILAEILLWNSQGAMGQELNQADPPGASAGTNLYHCPNHPEISASWAAKCPKCGENFVKRQEQPRQEASVNTRALWMRRNIMLHTSIDVFDPEAILSARRVLGLNQEQIEKLREISKTARENAMKILTDAQRKELSAAANLHNHPRTMARMHRRMLQGMPASDAAALNLMLQRMRIRNPRNAGVDPPTAPSAGSGNARRDTQDPFMQSSFDSLRGRSTDEARDRLRDQYRDFYRDQYRDNLAGIRGFGVDDFYNDNFGDENFDNEGFGNEGFGDEGFGNEGFGDEGFGEGYGEEGFGEEGFGREGFEREGRGGERFGGGERER